MVLTGSSAAGLTQATKALAGAARGRRIACFCPWGFGPSRAWCPARRRLSSQRSSLVALRSSRAANLRQVLPKPGAQTKLHCTDPIYANLTLDSESVAPPRLDFPRLSQQQLGLALLRAIEREAPGTLVGYDQVPHHRTASRKEIDFVGPQFGGAAFESKYVDGGWRRKALTLKASRWQGPVATRSESDLSDPEVAAVPAAPLAWLLDS